MLINATLIPSISPQHFDAMVSMVQYTIAQNTYYKLHMAAWLFEVEGDQCYCWVAAMSHLGSYATSG